jgi:hypothetical protein
LETNLNDQHTSHGYWLPNNEIYPNSKAGFDKTDISHLGPQCAQLFSQRYYLN